MTTIKKFFTVLLLLIVVFSVSSCKKDDNPVSSGGTLAGTWALASISATAATGTITLTADQANVHITMVLKSDNTYQMALIESGSTSNDTGNYSAQNGNITFTSQDGSQQVWSYTISGSTLTAKTTMDLSAYTQYGLSAQTPVTLVFNKQ
jgi:hypothetical protein